VDYEIHDGRAATTDLLVTVDAVAAGLREIPHGARAWALSNAGPRTAFEVGTSLNDTATYLVRREWNLGELVPYHWEDEAARVAGCGTTEILLGWSGNPAGTGVAFAEPIPDIALVAGDKLLFDVPPLAAGEPIRRHIARVVEIAVVDGSHILTDPLTGAVFHRVRLHPDDGFPFEVPQDRVRISANIVTAIAGETRHALMRCGPRRDTDPAWLASTVERSGPSVLDAATDPTAHGPILRQAERDRIDDGGDVATSVRPTVHLFSLSGTDGEGLAFVGSRLRETVPELVLREVAPGAVASLPSTAGPVAAAFLEAEDWSCQSRLVGSGTEDSHFTLEDGTWRRVVGYERLGNTVIHRDYASGGGYTVRFGDGVFGKQPQPDQVFYAVYRLGSGSRANRAADTVRALALPEDTSSRNMPAFVERVQNPLPVDSGHDRESLADVRMLAPEAWSASRLFALLPADYAEQSQKLDWVQRAYGKLRWTGSWPTMFVSADPRGAARLLPTQRRELADMLDCVRQTGRDVIVREPRYIPLDLHIHLCVEPWAYGGQVKQAVEERLVGPVVPGRPLPFFHPDRFTFGTPLRRAALESAIHDVRGVRSVLSMQIGARGIEPLRPFDELMYSDEREGAEFLLLLDADPRLPHRGTLRIEETGGA
jgi:hypothetical protein